MITDSTIQRLLDAQLEAGFAAQFISPATPPVVRLNNQPHQSATPSAWSVNYSAGRRRAWGFPKKKDVSAGGVITTTTTQVWHTTFTVGALAGPDDIMTSGDLDMLAQQILSHDNALNAFRTAGCNIFRIQELPGVWFVDDKMQNVLWSSFDVTFTYSTSIITTTPAATSIGGTPQAVIN